MVAGIQPNWRHICLAFILLVVIWYVFFNDSKAIQTGIKSPAIKKVQLEVYYEVWCPDSRRFILDQALPSWRKLNPYLDIHWKPYGKASHKIDENEPSGYKFECQHGPQECLGNMIHACAIKYVKDQNVLNELVGCMMNDNNDVKSNAQQCAQSHKVGWTPIKACSESPEGGELLAMHGDDTHSLKPSVHFIPTIQVNGSQDEQNQLLKNLAKAICQVHSNNCDKSI